MKGKKRVCLSEVAAAAGVSKMAASLALRGKKGVSEKTLCRIRAEASRLGYLPDAALSFAMSAIRRVQSGKYCGTIALLNANADPCAFSQHPTLPEFIRGIKRGARKLGYNIDVFWLHQKGLNADSLARIFESRGIRGGIVAGMYDNARLPTKFKPLWEKFKFVVAGLKTSNPELDYASADQFLIARNAVAAVLNMGYKRPGLALDKGIDDIVEGRFSGGFLRGQMELGSSDKVPPFLYYPSGKDSEELFCKWFKMHRPDAILSLYNTPKKWLEKMGFTVPEDVALVQLERRRSNPEWAGMNQHNDVVGELAVRRLAEFLNAPHSDINYPTATIVSPEWIESKTISKRQR